MRSTALNTLSVVRTTWSHRFQLNWFSIQYYRSLLDSLHVFLIARKPSPSFWFGHEGRAQYLKSMFLALYFITPHTYINLQSDHNTSSWVCLPDQTLMVVCLLLCCSSCVMHPLVHAFVHTDILLNLQGPHQIPNSLWSLSMNRWGSSPPHPPAPLSTLITLGVTFFYSVLLIMADLTHRALIWTFSTPAHMISSLKRWHHLNSYLLSLKW